MAKYRWTSTEDVLYETAKAAYNYRTEEERHWMIEAAADITWYIRTERAPYEWYRAYIRADKVKILRRIAKSDDKSTDGAIRIATAYLARYCGYKA